MKKVFNFFKQHPLMALLYVVSAVLMFFGDTEAGVMCAMAAVAVPEVGGLANTGEPQGTNGIAGKASIVEGQATTVSNVAEASDIIEADIDDDIVLIASDESVIDTIKRRVKRKVRMTSFEVDHYVVDEKPATIKLAKAVTANTNKDREAFEFEDGGNKLVKPYYTIVAKNTMGYKADGVTKDVKPLMLLCLGTDNSGYPIFTAINGPKSNPSDQYCTVPAIADEEEFLLCASMAYETQKHIAPSTVVPVAERMYLQKQLCNSIVSDYFDAQKKRVPFKESVIAEATIRQFRLESCRTAWFGIKSKVKVPANDPSLGEQFAYSSEGLRWQFKRFYDQLSLNDNGKLEFASLIDLMEAYFTTFKSSKKAVWVMGKKLLAAIQKVDFTLHTDVTMKAHTVWGVEGTQLHTVFGDITLVHDPVLDYYGYEWQGGIIDENGLVRYYMKNEDAKTENVEGEEAKRDIVMTIDCLCLKGPNHMWVDGSALKPKA